MQGCQYYVLGQVEAAAAKDELKRLRKEMLRLKNEWTTLKALYESAKVQPQSSSLIHDRRLLRLIPVTEMLLLHSEMLLTTLQVCSCLLHSTSLCQTLSIRLFKVRSCSYQWQAMLTCYAMLHVDVSNIEKHAASVDQRGMLKGD